MSAALAAWLLLSPALECRPLPAGQRWLERQVGRWDRRLRGESGYRRPARATVCELPEGRPFADLRGARLFVRPLRGADDQIALAHEYLHLAFAGHPRGRDEAFVEALARRLVLDPLESP